MKFKSLLGLCLSGSLLFGFTASAEEAEDSSAAFEADKAELAATHGVADSSSTFSVDENGVMSSVVGLSAMKMLVVRQDEDGNLIYGHADNMDQAEIFMESTESNKLEEE